MGVRGPSREDLLRKDVDLDTGLRGLTGQTIVSSGQAGLETAALHMRPEPPPHVIRQLGGRAVEQTDQVWDTGRRKDVPPRAELGTVAGSRMAASRPQPRWAMNTG